MPFKEGFDRMVIGLVAVLPLDDPGDLAVMDRRIELFQVENRAGDDVGILVPARVGRCSSISETEHAVLEEALGLLADGVAIDTGDSAPFGDTLVHKHDAADDLVVMLNRVGETQGELLKLLRCRHSGRPSPPSPCSLAGAGCASLPRRTTECGIST